MSVSNLDKQILQARMDVLENGSSISGFPIDFKISNQSLNFDPVFWDSEETVALSGKKRSNIRGWNLNITLDYNLSLEPQKIKDILDSFPNAIRTEDFEFRFYPNKDVADYIEVIPSGGTQYSIEWVGTVRTGSSDGVVPTVDLTSRYYRDTIDDFFQT